MFGQRSAHASAALRRMNDQLNGGVLGVVQLRQVQPEETGRRAVDPRQQHDGFVARHRVAEQSSESLPARGREVRLIGGHLCGTDLVRLLDGRLVGGSTEVMVMVMPAA